MSLDKIDKFRLYEAGFTSKEINELASAVDPTGKPQPDIDLNSPAWQAALNNRRVYTNNLRLVYERVNKKQLNRQTYDKIINQWYAKGLKRSTWDWLKISYKPRVKSDFLAAAKKRIKRQQRMLVNRVVKR